MGDKRLISTDRLKWERVGDNWEARGIAGIYRLTSWLNWHSYWTSKASELAKVVVRPMVASAETYVLRFEPLSGKTLAPAEVGDLEAGKRVCEEHNTLMMKHLAGRLREEPMG